jgi:hypothetical protein
MAVTSEGEASRFLVSVGVFRGLEESEGRESGLSD